MTAAPVRPPAGGPVDERFRAMGCELRVAVVPTPGDDATAAVARAVQFIHGADLALSRFDPASELRRAEATASRTVSVSPLLALAVDHARRAAERTGGLLDPTLAADIAAAGYADDWDAARRANLHELLPLAPDRRPARGRADAPWRHLDVDRDARTITRPPGVQLDLGATAKGLVADLVLRVIGSAELVIVDLAGDLAVGGDQLRREPLDVFAADPFDRPAVPLTLRAAGGLATSSIAARCWIDGDLPAHHLLDPSTGRPAFTGLVQATAAAPTAAEAELLAGHALLAGPDAAPGLLSRYGGVLVHDDGTTDVVVGSLLGTGGARDRS